MLYWRQNQVDFVLQWKNWCFDFFKDKLGKIRVNRYFKCASSQKLSIFPHFHDNSFLLIYLVFSQLNYQKNELTKSVLGVGYVFGRFLNKIFKLVFLSPFFIPFQLQSRNEMKKKVKIKGSPSIFSIWRTCH